MSIYYVAAIWLGMALLASVVVMKNSYCAARELSRLLPDAAAEGRA